MKELSNPSVHAGIGANLFGDDCSFRVWAPNAIAVGVILWYNGEITRMPFYPELSDIHYWSVDVQGVKADQQYQFEIENKGGDDSNPVGTFSRIDAYARQVESTQETGLELKQLSLKAPHQVEFY